MLTPKVTDISALSAHRREVALVRWSLVAVPEPADDSGKPDPRNPLHRIQSGRLILPSSSEAAW